LTKVVNTVDSPTCFFFQELFMMGRKFFLGVILAGIAMAGLATPARANFEILVYINGTLTSVTGGAANLGTNGSTANDFYTIGTAGAFNVNITSLTNWSGTPLSGLESNTSNNQVTLNTTLAAATTISIVISENNWTEPATAPLLLSSSAGGSIGSAGGALSVSATNQGFVDNSNTLATLAGPNGTSTTLANSSASLGGVGTNTLNYSPSPSTALAPGGVPFTLTQVFSFTFAAGATSGDTANVSGSVSVAPTPAPAALVLALTGLPFVGIGTWLRRRQVRLTAV
jgi:hypothetical protein